MYEKRSFEDEVNSARETFNRVNWQAMTTLGFDNTRGTTLYDFQVEYMYLVDTIERDSRFIANKTLSKLRSLTNDYREACQEAKKAKEKEKE